MLTSSSSGASRPQGRPPAHLPYQRLQPPRKPWSCVSAASAASTSTECRANLRSAQTPLHRARPCSSAAAISPHSSGTSAKSSTCLQSPPAVRRRCSQRRPAAEPSASSLSNSVTVP